MQKSGSRQTARSTGSARSVALAGGSQGASFIFTYVQRKEREEVNRFLTSVAWRQTGVSDSGCTKKKKSRRVKPTFWFFHHDFFMNPIGFWSGGKENRNQKMWKVNKRRSLWFGSKGSAGKVNKTCLSPSKSIIFVSTKCTLLRIFLFVCSRSLLSQYFF